MPHPEPSHIPFGNPPTVLQNSLHSLLVQVAFRGVFQFGVLVHNFRTSGDFLIQDVVGG